MFCTVRSVAKQDVEIMAQEEEKFRGGGYYDFATQQKGPLLPWLTTTYLMEAEVLLARVTP